MSEKEKQILKSALDLFVTMGFHGASTALIAENASVSNGTLFHYFASKDVLIQKLHLHLRKEQIFYISDGIENQKGSREKIRQIWVRSIEWAMNNQAAFNFLRMYRYSPFRKKMKGDAEEFRKKFIEIVGQGISQKQIRYMPEDLVYEITRSNTFGMIEYLELNPIKYRTPEFMRQAFERFWDSLKA